MLDPTPAPLLVIEALRDGDDYDYRFSLVGDDPAVALADRNLIVLAPTDLDVQLRGEMVLVGFAIDAIEGEPRPDCLRTRLDCAFAKEEYTCTLSLSRLRPGAGRVRVTLTGLAVPKAREDLGSTSLSNQPRPPKPPLVFLIGPAEAGTAIGNTPRPPGDLR